MMNVSEQAVDTNELDFTCDEPGVRLDAALVARVAALSRRAAKQICKSGDVLVNGKRAKAGQALMLGDRVTVKELPDPARARPELLAGPDEAKQHIKILFEDEHLLAVCKPSGMPSVTLRGDDPLTLADCVAAYCPVCVGASPDVREAGLTQRLDYYTSGVVLVAKSRAVWEKLRAGFSDSRFEKSYVALVEGEFKSLERVIKFPLIQGRNRKITEALHAGSPLSDSPISEQAVSAETIVSLVKVYYTPRLRSSLSLVRAKTSRGRRHQVRVHLATSGHPLLGDELYGSHQSFGSALGDCEAIACSKDGYLLHAESVSGSHPVTGAALEVVAPAIWSEQLDNYLA